MPPSPCTVSTITAAGELIPLLESPNTLSRYSVMLQCWENEAEKRPSFEEIVKLLASQLAEMAGYIPLTSPRMQD